MRRPGSRGDARNGDDADVAREGHFGTRRSSHGRRRGAHGFGEEVGLVEQAGPIATLLFDAT